MNLRALRTFVEIDRVGSFAVAAERLGQTLSAVSTQMKALESELQLSLFDRSLRPPKMTPVARQVVVHARRILDEADAVLAIHTSRAALHGVIRVGFVATASVRFMPGFLARGRIHHPDVRFEVETGLSKELLSAVQSSRLDAAIVTETPRWPKDVIFASLARERFALAVPDAARHWSLEQCAQTLTHVQFKPDTGIGLLVEQYLETQSLQAPARLVLDSVEAVMGCVNAGVGFALLPEPDVTRYADQAVVRVDLEPGFERRLGLAVRDGGPLSGQIPSVAALFERSDQV